MSFQWTSGFLCGLFLTQLVYFGLCRLVRCSRLWLWSLTFLSLVVGYLSGWLQPPSPFGIRVVPAILFFYSLGCLLRDYFLCESPGRPRSTWPAVSLLAVSLLAVTVLRVLLDSHPFGVGLQFSTPSQTTGALCGVVGTLMLARMVAGGLLGAAVKRALDFIGRNTLTFMIVQTVPLNLWHRLHPDGMGGALYFAVEMALTFGVCTLCVYVWDWLKAARR